MTVKNTRLTSYKNNVFTKLTINLYIFCKRDRFVSSQWIITTNSKVLFHHVHILNMVENKYWLESKVSSSSVIAG